MPIEIGMYGASENEIRRIYEKTSELAPYIDSGEMSIGSFNAQVQQIKEELFDVRCLVSVEQVDGSGLCVNYQRAKW